MSIELNKFLSECKVLAKEFCDTFGVDYYFNDKDAIRFFNNNKTPKQFVGEMYVLSDGMS